MWGRRDGERGVRRKRHGRWAGEYELALGRAPRGRGRMVVERRRWMLRLLVLLLLLPVRGVVQYKRRPSRLGRHEDCAVWGDAGREGDWREPGVKRHVVVRNDLVRPLLQHRLSVHHLGHGQLVRLLCSPPLRPAVLEPNLNSRFRQVDPRSQVLAHEDVRIVSLCEGGLQFLQLVASERRAEPPLLPLLGLSAFSVTAVGFGGVGRLGFAAFLLELRVVIFHAVLPR